MSDVNQTKKGKTYSNGRKRTTSERGLKKSVETRSKTLRSAIIGLVCDGVHAVGIAEAHGIEWASLCAWLGQKDTIATIQAALHACGRLVPMLESYESMETRAFFYRTGIPRTLFARMSVRITGIKVDGLLRGRKFECLSNSEMMAVTAAVSRCVQAGLSSIEAGYVLAGSENPYSASNLHKIAQSMGLKFRSRGVTPEFDYAEVSGFGNENKVVDRQMTLSSIGGGEASCAGDVDPVGTDELSAVDEKDTTWDTARFEKPRKFYVEYEIVGGKAQMAKDADLWILAAETFCGIRGQAGMGGLSTEALAMYVVGKLESMLATAEKGRPVALSTLRHIASCLDDREVF